MSISVSAAAIACRVNSNRIPYALITRGALGLFAAIFLVAGSAAFATEDSPKRFEINAKPLADALIEFGAQSGLTIAVPTVLIAGKTGAPVRGDLLPTVALEELLNGSGLIVARAADGTIAIQAASSEAVSDSTPARASAVESSSEKDLTGPEQLVEVVVTAEKHAAVANEVPMSITTATGTQLANEGISQPRDLANITPGFSYADSYLGTPIYTLRGVGFSDTSLVGRSTVGIYVDEAPIPFAIETRGADLDLDRVEVLKGPQGTLFGNNATGGAINYIAAKPTEEVTGGMNASYGNYNAMDLSAFVSGPLSSTLAGRIAFDHTQQDDWQKSYTTGATTGAVNFTNGRVILAWTPDDSLKMQLTVNGWKDTSDTPASQLIAVVPLVPAYASSVPGLINYPLAPANARAADFTPGDNYAKDNGFVQSNLRTDYKLSLDTTLTSLTSFSEYDENQFMNAAGVTLDTLDTQTTANLNSVSQELRISSDLPSGLQVVAGVNGEFDWTKQSTRTTFPQSTTAYAFYPLGLPSFDGIRFFDDQQMQTYAAFGDVNYAVNSSVKVYAGARFTQSDDKFSGCSADLGDGHAADDLTGLFNIFRPGLGLPPIPPIPPGGCITGNAQLTPGLVTNELNESNVSWRAGSSWEPSHGMLFYANVTKGFKAGGFPSTGATSSAVLQPIKQESVLAYEAGFKTSFLDRTLQLNGAAFYYDYRDKQFYGRILDPILGPLFTLVNIPKSKITGAELQLDWLPLRGLEISAGGSYIDSEILDNFTNYNPFTVKLEDFGGEAFPNTPKWQLTSDVEYRAPLNNHVDWFVGGNASYRSGSFSQLGDYPLLALNGYALVDLRAGLESADQRWRFSVWGRNVGNRYYWTAASYSSDVITRIAGMPATYGIQFSYRFSENGSGRSDRSTEQ
jgi:iron complex outermembrane receptor protein